MRNQSGTTLGINKNVVENLTREMVKG